MMSSATGTPQEARSLEERGEDTPRVGIGPQRLSDPSNLLGNARENSTEKRAVRLPRLLDAIPRPQRGPAPHCASCGNRIRGDALLILASGKDRFCDSGCARRGRA